jgi:ketosteroid isomerase-like protein
VLHPSEIHKAFDAQRAAGAIERIEGTTRKIYVAGDVTLTSAGWKGDFTAADGTIQVRIGTTAELCRRQPDGTWKMVIDDPTFV